MRYQLIRRGLRAMFVIVTGLLLIGLSRQQDHVRAAALLYGLGMTIVKVGTPVALLWPARRRVG